MRHYSPWYIDDGMGNNPTACGTHTDDITAIWVPREWQITCEACKATKMFQEDVIAFDIGFEGNIDAWKDYKPGANK